MCSSLLLALALSTLERPTTSIEALFHPHSGREISAWIERGAARFAARLERSWTPRPEWGDMCLSLLQGDDLRPGKGWYQPSVDRRGWEWLRARFDRDLDASISRDEL